MAIMENETEINQKQSRAIAVDEEVVAFDDVSGVALDPAEVIRARLEEMEWMRMKGVYKKITRKEAKQRGMKLVRSRRVDINKGDDEKRNYRSREVAQEFNDGSQMVEDLFAGTPPLEAVRMLLSEAATVEDGDAGTRVIVLADVKNAFYEALAKRRMCMELPEEDKSEEDKRLDVAGELMLAMPGTRYAGNSKRVGI